ncbi:MAG: alpha/beta fold hydrolase [Paraglaciecola sp.]|uniref:alpha/beta hydrolase n=1 Tax=Paraglaciecola sp. TaxID=1920173 RepID=UPI003298A040
MSKFYNALLAGLSLSIVFSSCAAPKEAIHSATEPSSGITKDFVLNTGSSATIEQPKCKAKSAVLLIHGWVGQKDEVGDLYKDLSAQLRGSCIASLRFDVQGEAEREKSNFTLTSTFKSRMEDTEAALAYLKKQYPTLPLVVVGFSLGGATAMELVSRHPKTFEGVVLWSSALNPNEIVTQPSYYAAVRGAIDEGESVLKEAWADLTFTRQHVIGMLGYNPIRNLGEFEGHLLAIRGSDDYLPAHEKTIFEASKAVTEDAYYLGGADHVFDVFDPENSQKDKVLGLTLSWITSLKSLD